MNKPNYLSLLKSSLILFSILFIAACIPQQKEAAENALIPQVKILLSSVSAKDSINFLGNYFLNTEEARYEFGKTNASVFLEATQKGFKIYNANRLFLFRNSDVVSFQPENSDSRIGYRGNQYAGEFVILKADSNIINIINLVNLESYLAGVVPAEIFTQSPSYIEAIKAQAICARTYAMKKMKDRKGKSFHLYADVRDQVYKGEKQRTKLGDKAVKETEGSVLMFNQNLAETYYHASCGGVLEDDKSVWQNNDLPYLKVQQDVFSNQFADFNSPYYRWRETRTVSQLDSMFNQYFNITYSGKVVTDTLDIPLNLKILERTGSGRVKKIALQYNTENVEIDGYKIRQFLGGAQNKLLPSTLFRLTQTDSSLIIEGAGNGHGVGLCQYGAIFKAENGLQFYHILQSYYPGTVLRKIY